MPTASNRVEGIRELIRRDQERLCLRGLLLDGAEAPRSGEPDAACFAGLRARGRQAEEHHDGGQARSGEARRVRAAIGGGGKPRVRGAKTDADVPLGDRPPPRSLAPRGAGLRRCVEEARARIRRAPARGSPRCPHPLDLPGLRFRPRAPCPYLVFDVERADSIDIRRVLHAGRDIPHRLEEGLG